MKRKIWFGIGLLSAAAALVSGIYLALPGEPTFEEAKKDSGRREAYVECVEKRFKLNELPYVEDVYYSAGEGAADFPTSVEGKPAMKTEWKGKTDKDKDKIAVYDLAFNPDFNEADFLSTLIDHEIEGHARPAHFAFSDIGYFDEDEFVEVDGGVNVGLLSSIYELYAYRNQIRMASERGVDSKFMAFICQSYWEHYSNIIHPESENRLKDKKPLRKFRELFFLPNFLTQEITMDGVYSGTVIMPDRRMFTPYGPIELPDYLKEKIKEWKGK